MSPPIKALDPGASRWRVALAVTLVGLLGGAGCGDDEGGRGSNKDAKAKAEEDKAAKKKKKDDKAKADAGKGGKGKRPEVISFIPTLEKVVPEEDRKKIRRKLKERDFSIDFTGTDNRDPFRSYLLPQLSADGGGEPTVAATAGQPTELCTKSQLVAPGHALRDLSLIGIVRRGTTRYALFRDSGGVGHIVDRGKCLGREKAKVTEIGESLVTIEILPELPPDATVIPPPEKKSIPLYPSELAIDDFDETDDAPSAPSVAPAAPPTPPATMAPPDGSPTAPPPGDGT